MDKDQEENRPKEERRSGVDRRKEERRNPDRASETGVLSTRTGERRRPGERRNSDDSK